VLRDLFRKSGRPLEREADLVPVEPLREHRFEDGTRLSMPSGSRAAQKEAVDEALGDGLGTQWVDYVHDLAPVWDRLRRDFFEHPYEPGRADKETENVLRSRLMMHKAVTRRFRDKRLRTLALHHAVQGGHDPRNVPAWFGLVDYLEQNFGTWTFPDGFGTLAGLLEKRLAERKVAVLTATTAKDVVMGTGRPERGRDHERGGRRRRRRRGRRPAAAAGARVVRRTHDALDPPGRHPPRASRRRCRTCRARSWSTTSTSSRCAPTGTRRRARARGR
jgi:hypothetical protein